MKNEKLMGCRPRILFSARFFDGEEEQIPSAKNYQVPRR